MANEGIHCRFGTMEDVEEPWCKMLLASLEQPAIKAFTEALAPQGVRFVASSDRYWEMLPEDAHKGTGIQRLAQACGYSLAQVAAIGDYYKRAISESRQASRRRLPTHRRRFAKWRDLWPGPAMKAR